MEPKDNDMESKETFVPVRGNEMTSDGDELLTSVESEINAKLVIRDSPPSVQSSVTEAESLLETNSKTGSLTIIKGDEDKTFLSLFQSAVNSAVAGLKIYLADNRKVQSKQELSVVILQSLQSIASCIEDASEESVKGMCSILTSNPEDVRLFYAFLSQVFDAFRGGLDPCHSQCVVMVHALIVTLTEKFQEFSKFIVDSGLLIEHIDQLCKMRDTSTSQEAVQFFVQLNLSTIHNCSQSVKINNYFLAPEFNCVPIFKPFAMSPQDCTRLHSKFILGSLSELLSHDEVEQLLQLTPSTMKKFLEAIESSTTNNSHEVHCLESVFSLSEAILSLNSLLINEKNCEMIVSKNVIPALVTLLACGSTSEKESGCQLIWNLLLSAKHGLQFKQQLASSEISIDNCLSCFLDSENNALSLLSSCLFFLLDPNKRNDMQQCLNYAEGSYIYSHYPECKEACELVLQSKSSKPEQKERAKLLLGKASFRIYQQLCFRLKRMKQLELQFTKEYQELHKRNCDMMKSTISLLGSALDHGCFGCQGDAEELMMLNMALVDYANEGRNSGRCLLCLQRRELKKSHYFPKSLLDDFSRGTTIPTDRKIFRHDVDSRGVDKSPKEMIYNMFCANCEDHFSKHGETQFHPNFFKQIYDDKDTSKVVSKQEIEYGKWLYQFCIGILFRGIIVGYKDTFINSSHLFNLLQRLREILFSFAPEKFSPKMSSYDHIPVAVFFNPAEPRPEDSEYPLMMRVLNSILKYVFIQCPLYSDCLSRPHRIHCLMVHFGVINIVLPVHPGEFQNVPHDCLVDPSGGTFRVLSSEERISCLPAGVWKTFQCMAVESENVMFGWPEKVRSAFEKKDLQQPTDSAKQLFRFVESREKSAQALDVITPSNISHVVKRVNFLPDQFLVRPSHSPSSLCLPSGHKILVHKNFPLDPIDSSNDMMGETLFLAVGTKPPYSLDKPYILYHRFEPGLQINAGFFISPADLSAQEFLPDPWPKELKERLEWEVIENARSVCHRLLPEVLAVKGILNCAALLKRVQSHAQTFSELPSYDVKCKSPCWYCKELCQVCMKPSSFGLAVRKSDDSVLRFCSKECQLFTADEAPPLVLEVWEPLEHLPGPQFQARRIESSHNELLYMLIKGQLSSGQYCKINLTLVSGDGHMHYPKDRVYAVYHLRTLEEQQCMEFFLGEDLHPEEVLLYAACQDADVALARRRSTNEIKNLVFMALTVKGYASLQNLLQKYTS